MKNLKVMPQKKESQAQELIETAAREKRLSFSELNYRNAASPQELRQWSLLTEARYGNSMAGAVKV
jgi:hypothetical protein